MLHLKYENEKKKSIHPLNIMHIENTNDDAIFLYACAFVNICVREHANLLLVKVNYFF